MKPPCRKNQTPWHITEVYDPIRCDLTKVVISRRPTWILLENACDGESIIKLLKGGKKMGER